MNRNKDMKRTEENMIHKRQKKNTYNIHRIGTSNKTKIMEENGYFKVIQENFLT